MDHDWHIRGQDYPPSWRASLNAAELGKHPTRDAAKDELI
jgi:hypothetical protein